MNSPRSRLVTKNGKGDDYAETTTTTTTTKAPSSSCLLWKNDVSSDHSTPAPILIPHDEDEEEESASEHRQEEEEQEKQQQQQIILQDDGNISGTSNSNNNNRGATSSSSSSCDTTTMRGVILPDRWEPSSRPQIARSASLDRVCSYHHRPLGKNRTAETEAAAAAASTRPILLSRSVSDSSLLPCCRSGICVNTAKREFRCSGARWGVRELLTSVLAAKDGSSGSTSSDCCGAMMAGGLQRTATESNVSNASIEVTSGSTGRKNRGGVVAARDDDDDDDDDDEDCRVVAAAAIGRCLSSTRSSSSRTAPDEQQGMVDDDIAKKSFDDKCGGGSSSMCCNNKDGKMSSIDTKTNNGHEINSSRIVPYAAKTITTGRFFYNANGTSRQQRQQGGQRKKVGGGVRKTKKRRSHYSNGREKYYDYSTSDNNDNNINTVLLLPTSIVVGVMLGIVVAFVVVALRRSAMEIAELRSTVLNLQSTVLELQSSVIELHEAAGSSTDNRRGALFEQTMKGEMKAEMGEKIVQSTSNHGQSIHGGSSGTSSTPKPDVSATEAALAEVRSEVEQTGRTMERVVEAVDNLEKTVYQLESTIARKKTEPISEQQMINNESSSFRGPTTARTLSFDDRETTDFDQLPDAGYHGLGFVNLWTVSPDSMTNVDCVKRSGLARGTVSHPSVAVNAYGEPASIRAMEGGGDDDGNVVKTRISVSSLVATPVGRNNVQLNVEGLRGSTMVRATMVTLPSTERPTTIALKGFEDLTELRLETAGGTLVSEDCQFSSIVAFDDIVYRIHHYYRDI